MGVLVSSINKTDSYDITVILLKVALNTIKQAHATCKINNCQDVIRKIVESGAKYQ